MCWVRRVSQSVAATCDCGCFTDIDECKENKCDADAECINTHGSYECKCKPGFYHNMKSAHPEKCVGMYSLCQSNVWGSDNCHVQELWSLPVARVQRQSSFWRLCMADAAKTSCPYWHMSYACLLHSLMMQRHLTFCIQSINLAFLEWSSW